MNNTNDQHFDFLEHVRINRDLVKNIAKLAPRQHAHRNAPQQSGIGLV